MSYKQGQRAERPRATLYQEVTDRIVSELEQGIVPWVQPWGSGVEQSAIGLPRNAATGRTYSGINILILWGRLFDEGYPSQQWLTFRQAITLGGTVRKGEHGVGICYADRFVPKERQTNSQGDPSYAPNEAVEPQAVAFLRRYTVFNAAQCDGLPDHCHDQASPLPERAIVPEAEALARATLADIRHGGDEAYYECERDYVQLPPHPAFFDQINYYRTLFHELGHWTGHASRLKRDQTGSFGSKPYASEELVAELTAAFVCATLSIRPTVRHADYIGNWIDVLRGDNRAIFHAASRASKAADFLLAFRPQVLAVSAAAVDASDMTANGAADHLRRPG
ncbi:zincin-like metallopeptidase domain-containing protein [Bradyrhizobium sp. NAS96.2]|uniref:ArdC family protein n=1 Tax=Bradyrhizobium sp. NAS96.2 TaxID=1680160 RepID=UPI00093F96AE|nr:zincin-like metallopeptidase domain-containing protein [Bradyrhizobium sp. NAS96.2]OKO78310.1 antirepressor [Bradyrhizobium sp. NAS96.2]